METKVKIANDGTGQFQNCKYKKEFEIDSLQGNLPVNLLRMVFVKIFAVRWADGSGSRSVGSGFRSVGSGSRSKRRLRRRSA